VLVLVGLGLSFIPHLPEVVSFLSSSACNFQASCTRWMANH